MLSKLGLALADLGPNLARLAEIGRSSQTWFGFWPNLPRMWPSSANIGQTRADVLQTLATSTEVGRSGEHEARLVLNMRPNLADISSTACESQILLEFGRGCQTSESFVSVFVLSHRCARRPKRRPFENPLRRQRRSRDLWFNSELRTTPLFAGEGPRSTTDRPPSPRERADARPPPRGA